LRGSRLHLELRLEEVAAKPVRDYRRLHRIRQKRLWRLRSYDCGECE
jgi:hypothetical protein